MTSTALPAVTLHLSADLDTLPAVRDALTEIVRAHADVRLRENELTEVCIATQEACTNVIRHALDADAQRRFRVDVRADADALRIVVTDDGPPFELGDRAAPPPEDLAEGGYGIPIMRACFDELRVERAAGGNVLTLVRRYRAPAAHGCVDG